MAEPTAPPSPDRGHEALRQDILATISDVNRNTGDTATGLDLTDVVFELLDGLYAQIDALNIRCDALQIDRDTAMASIDDLQSRVAALEQLSPPEA